MLYTVYDDDICPFAFGRNVCAVASLVFVQMYQSEFGALAVKMHDPMDPLGQMNDDMGKGLMYSIIFTTLRSKKEANFPFHCHGEERFDALLICRG